ncbi:MAG: tetratricopeptide repeat protein [Candidatus Krumholzibacteria bacterium]|jgi:tetratricopeptide (TPR) repeat protein|nr:tetratricopeptide repeat protein [Candidatus Krumholzibacteria bacterium]
MPADFPGLAQQIAHFESRLQADPASRVFLPLADLYRRAGELERARQLLSEGLANDPDFLSARTALGEVLMLLGQATAARIELQAVLARDPDNLLALRLLVDDATARQEWPLACSLGERLLRLQPEVPAIRKALRDARSKLGQNDAATAPPRGPDAGASGLLKVGSGFETPTLADLYRRQGYPEKARAILQRILDAEPDRQDALDVLARLNADAAAAPETPAAAARSETATPPSPATLDPRSPGRTAAARARDRAAGGSDRSDDLDRFRAWLDTAAESRNTEH